MDNKPTKGEKKILLQFERFVETDIFKQKVGIARKLIKLPLNGIKLTEKDLKNLPNLIKVYIPENFPTKDIKKAKKLLDILHIETAKIADLFPVCNYYLLYLIKNQILFNKFFYNELEVIKNFFEESNICELEDVESEIDKYAKLKDTGSLFRYPMAIRVHSEASQRDVIEFIKRHWYLIKLYQDSCVNNKVSSFKNSKSGVNKMLQKRNNFIYNNKLLPRKKIVELLIKRYGSSTVDEGSVGKIISVERKRREKM